MQKVNLSQECCNKNFLFANNELFNSDKILHHKVYNSDQVINNDLKVFGTSFKNNSYEKKKNELCEVEASPKQTTKTTKIFSAPSIITNIAKATVKSSDNKCNDLNDHKKNDLNLEMCSLKCSYTEGNFEHLDTKRSSADDLLKNLRNDVAEEKRFNMSVGGQRKKIGEIVSTSRSGHLIARKDDSYKSAFLKNMADKNTDGCDTNDNIINSKVLINDTYDINENLSDDSNIQEDEEKSLSDNCQSGRSEGDPFCEISLLERLIRSHPVWFLRGIQRAGAVHLLQGKEEGNFIVRQSSQKDTMAVSVRLPLGKGPYIEHYLIQKVNSQLSLESSENMFESIPSLIAHYCQCCDELPVQLTLPATIREAKNRQQLSSLALLGQEFWRYPMANPRPPESQNSSPGSQKSDCKSPSEVKNLGGKDAEDIVLNLVPLDFDSQNPTVLGTFQRSQIDGENSIKEIKPKRPQTLDLVTANTDKTGLLNGNKTPPQPPPRWTKPSLSVSTKPNLFMASAEPTSRLNLTTPVFEDDSSSTSELKHFVPLFSSSFSDGDRSVSSPQSDSTIMKSFNYKTDKNSFKLFRNQNKMELISPVSDTTNLVSKSLEKAKLQQQQSFICSDKFDRVFKRYKKENKKDNERESAHYQESDILEPSAKYFYKSNIADKQSDYEDIWATESFTTFKPNDLTEDREKNHCETENKNEGIKKPPDLLEELESSFRLSFKDKKKENRFILKEDFRKDCCNSDAQVTECLDIKQSSPFYAEPADALVVRRKEKISFNKSRHSDPFSFNNWSIHTNPYFSGGNILGRIDSENEVTEDNYWKTKPSLSFDNIINLKHREMDTKSKAIQKGKGALKGKPVRPPNVHNVPLEKGHQNWAVDSSWEFIGNETIEREGDFRFPSIEQQMDSEEATSYKATVQEMIAKRQFLDKLDPLTSSLRISRFPHFKISKGFWNKITESGENLSSQQTQTQKIAKTDSRISAYDNLTCDRFSALKSGKDMGLSEEMNCDSSSSCLIIPESSHKQYGEPEASSITKNPILSDTLRYKRRLECGSLTEENEDAQTIFSEPWDSSRWENLLSSTGDSSRNPSLDGVAHVENSFVGENLLGVVRSGEKMIKPKDYAFQQTTPRGKELAATGASIRSYALHLASDKSTTFAQNIDNFIECTLESKEANPQVVMRNMRQFMSGMKNYLVKHGEREFEKQVEQERMKLKSTEFLNLDAILERVMHKLVVRPLREHLYKLFVDEYVRNGAIQLLYENLNYARTKSLKDLGLKLKISPPSQDAMERICHFIAKLQEVDSPLEKLDHLLASVSTIIYSVKHANQEKAGIALGADDILPFFVWVLIHSGFIAAEIEAEYMWGLLHPSLLSGEGCYYLTTLSSAVHFLKNLKSSDLNQLNRSTLNEWRCGDFKSVLKIIVPDELHGSILTKTLPVKPNMTTKDVCKIIAHKIRITNPQDYGLFRLVDGEETLLNDSDCPQDVKSQFLESGRHCTLAYKRIDAKIGWPRTT